MMREKDITTALRKRKKREEGENERKMEIRREKGNKEKSKVGNEEREN